MTRNKHSSALPPLLSSHDPAEAQSPRSLVILESAALGLSLEKMDHFGRRQFEWGLLQVVTNLSAFAPVLPCGLFSSWI